MVTVRVTNTLDEICQFPSRPDLKQSNFASNSHCISLSRATPYTNAMKTQFMHFTGLKNALLVSLFQQRVSQNQLELDAHESMILQALLVKKKFSIAPGTRWGAQSINRLAAVRLSRPKEYNTKFVLLRCVKKLKGDFAARLVDTFGPGPKRSKARTIEKLFYSHFFGEIARNKGLPLERFYAFKNWTHRRVEHIPKSVTQSSLDLWKLNPQFVARLRDYIDGAFLDDFIKSNSIKIVRMVAKWSCLADEIGYQAAVDSVLKSLRYAKCKLPWALSEVRFAMCMVKKILEKP